MALFKKKAEEKIKKTESRALAAVVPVRAASHAGQAVIIRPKLTEKISFLEAKQPVYLFEVSRGATKRSVAAAIAALYKVTPVKIAIVRIPPKKSFSRGLVSYGATRRKAYVYLSKGEKIEIA